jgi:hypothetical protein
MDDTQKEQGKNNLKNNSIDDWGVMDDTPSLVPADSPQRGESSNLVLSSVVLSSADKSMPRHNCETCHGKGRYPNGMMNWPCDNCWPERDTVPKRPAVDPWQ